MESIIENLSNNDYHNSPDYKEYISSTQLKLYAISPKHFRFKQDNPDTEQTDSMKFGSLFHDLMASLVEHYDNTAEAISLWRGKLAVFTPPVNEKTGKPYGSSTNAYTNAYNTFVDENKDAIIASQSDIALCLNMVESLLSKCGSTSTQVMKLLKWGKPEVSIFHETEDGIKIKIRPDLLTPKKIVDWKTTNSDDLREEAINNLVLKYGYHISAAQYVWTYHEVSGKWLTFYLVIVSKMPPHDAVIVDMTNYAYRYLKDVGVVVPGCGAMEFKRLMELHKKCTKTNEWPGAETFISSDPRYKIMEIVPPRWYYNKFIEE